MVATGTQTVAAIRRVIVNALDDVEIETVPQPEPGPGEVRVRTTLVGICGSDLHAACGRHPFIDLPYRPGHEAVGVVEALGEGVDESWQGARVAVEPNLACGTCTQCRDGRYNICRDLRVFGCQTPGALADSFVIGVDRLVVLNDDLDDRHAILIEPLATPVHTVRRAEKVVGDLADRGVVVIGAGPIGLFALLAARHAGARVVVADLLESKRARAERLGAVGTFDPTAPNAVATALELLGGPAAVVIDCVARESSVAQAVDLVDKGGAVMIVGVAEGATPVPLGLIQDREIALIGNLMYVRDDFTAAVEMLESGVVPVGEIISAEYDFDRAGEAFAASADGENVKVLVSMGNPS
ncbi:alcohol dehydrogenase catalytic domain-containing protein [Mycolicibacterium smegmatis]|uniref:zinc-dependent alcohol dehydrogenase n=1 Tax=Mycolicibacterium smegmatis TaxID=1772 RepID=UPI001E2E4A5F|nr:alcohol dehydrogenase catalytic domain-containing protein [Mycolicibacterium smegmatis]UGU32709.1 alcohol dehydrogenase catalytic domain-containing protein [Mycolicibacterium smegmatis]ULN67595.1 alcohol dehydrogenase catalytic domain-containing protein [Mycolicibacterium smegmatis]